MILPDYGIRLGGGLLLAASLLAAGCGQDGPAPQQGSAAVASGIERSVADVQAAEAAARAAPAPGAGADANRRPDTAGGD